MRKAVHLRRSYGPVKLSLISGQRRFEVPLTDEEAHHLAYRLMSFGSGNYGDEMVIDKEAD